MIDQASSCHSSPLAQRRYPAHVVAEDPNVADWLQGVGTVAAFAVTGAGLLWEARARRVQRGDQDLAVARCVIVRPHLVPNSTDTNTGQVLGVKAVGATIENCCAEPLFNVRLFAIDAGLVVDPPSGRVVHIEPGGKASLQFRLAREITSGVTSDPARVLPRVAVDYQVGGRRWVRFGSTDPLPWPHRSRRPDSKLRHRLQLYR
jgi:hypothetical protein